MYGISAAALRARSLQPTLPRLQRSARSTLANRRHTAYTLAHLARAPAAAVSRFQYHPRRLISGVSPAPQPNQPDPTESGPDPNDRPRKNPKPGQSKDDYWETAFKMFESAMTTFASVAVLGYVARVFALCSDTSFVLVLYCFSSFMSIQARRVQLHQILQVHGSRENGQCLQPWRSHTGSCSRKASSTRRSRRWLLDRS